MAELRKLEEKEELQQDGRKLRRFELEIKETARRKYDELHREFLCENNDIQNVEQLNLVRNIFEFLKKKA